MNGVLIVGCGFVGNEFVRQYSAANKGPLFAITRTHDRAEELRARGVQPLIGHWQDTATLPSIGPVDTILVSVPHREDSNCGIQSHIVGLKNLVDRIPSFRKLIYLSTTGVYGDADGEADELTAVQPTRIGPQIAVATERWLSERFAAPRLAIIRLAGIYGPGRVPLAEKLRSGEALQVPREGWLNLVHVADIASMLMKAIETDLPQSLYVFSDGQPVPRMNFYNMLAALCDVNDPKFADPEPNSSRAQRAGKKRINPQRLISDLGIKLKFPSYHEGLKDCV